MTTAAAPYEHVENFHGIQIYECLTRQVRHIRHGPSNTTWVYAYRGVTSAGVPVIVFRPGPWLMDLDDVRGDKITEDLAGHAIEGGSDERCGWAAVPAPLGVRLRAIVLELAERGQRLPERIVLDVVERTRQALPLGRTGDTFVGWDGSLWLAPTFPRSWKSEAPSINIGDVYDALVLDGSVALREVLTGTVPRSIISFSEGNPGYVPRPALPRDITTALGEIADGSDAALNGERFFARCAQIAPPAVAPSELATLARELFPDAYVRQDRAMSN